MNLPDDEIHPLLTHSATYANSSSPSNGSLTDILFLESDFFIDAGVGTLLYFQQNGVFLHTKSVASAHCQNYIARAKFTGGHQLPIAVVDIYLTMASLD